MEWLPLSSQIMFICVLAASGFGGLLICLRRTWSNHALDILISAGGGLLLAITILEMLPHSMEQAGGSQMPLVLLGFSALFVAERIKGSGKQEHAVGMISVFLGLVIHAFMEGMSLLASYRVDVQLGYSLLVALFFHKIPEGITAASLLLAATRSRWLAFLGSGTLGLATFLGVISVTLAEYWLPLRWPHIVLSLSTGLFLYVSACHLVPFVRNSRSTGAGISFFAAILFYLLISFYTDHGTHLHV